MRRMVISSKPRNLKSNILKPNSEKERISERKEDLEEIAGAWRSVLSIQYSAPSSQVGGFGRGAKVGQNSMDSKNLGFYSKADKREKPKKKNRIGVHGFFAQKYIV